MIELGKKVLSKTGGIPSELYTRRSNDFTVEVSGGKIENINVSRSAGMGLRMFSAGKVGFAYATDFEGAALSRMVQQAKANADSASEDRYNRMPGALMPKKNRLYDLCDDRLESMSSDEKIDIARSMEQKALKYDKRIKKVIRSSFSTSDYEVGIVNSEVPGKTYKGTLYSAELDLVAEDAGEIQSGWDVEDKRFFSDLNYEGIVETACSRAISMLGSRKVESQSVPVVFDPMVTCQFLEALSGSLCADRVQKGKSLFAEKTGRKIASSCVNLVDDGTLERGVGTSVFDAEGTGTQKTVLIEDGVLRGFLYNDYTANKGGVESTGNAARTFRGIPGVEPGNLILQAGSVDRESLIDIDRGIYVFGTLGMHTVDTISGDFSIGINGTWIKDGKCREPVGGVTIAGNIIELLNSIDSVASDIKFYGSVGAPSVRIKSLMLGGK